MTAPPPLRWMPAAARGGLFRPPAATFVVIHCTESDNNAGTAESLAGPNWFGGPAGTSAHRMFDRDSGVEMVRGSNVAFHAGPGGNTWGRSYEFCGRVAWSTARWRAPEQLAMLQLAAPYIAQDLVEITGSRTAALAACRWLSVAQVAQKAPGLCTHNDIRLALGGTSHTDPGPNFPYAELLAYVRAELTGTTPTGGATGTAKPPLEDDMPSTVIDPGQAVCLPATTKATDLWIALDNPERRTVKLSGSDGPDTLVEGCTLRIAVQRADRTWHPVDMPGYPVDPRDRYVTNLALGSWGAGLAQRHGVVVGVSISNRGHIPVAVALAPAAP